VLVFHDIGGVKGAQPGVYAICGPGVSGDIPGEMTELRTRTKIGVAALRVFVNGETDLAEAVDAQRGFHLLPPPAYLRHLRLLGIVPLLEKQPGFNPKYLGWFIAAYFGGQPDVRVRKFDVPVRPLDFTAMCATIFCLQRLDKILTAPKIRIQPITGEIRALVAKMASDNRSVSLFDRKLSPKLNCLELLDPRWQLNARSLITSGGPSDLEPPQAGA
jgi:hypothetical protein